MAAHNTISPTYNVFADVMEVQMWKEDDKGHASVPNVTPAGYWFDEQDVNDIEREYVENIFRDCCGSMEDAMYHYVNIRSRIIDLYRKDTTKYITSNDCVQALKDDPSTIARIYCLLNYWRIINYEALRTTKDTDGHLNQFKRNCDNIWSAEENDSDDNMTIDIPALVDKCDEDNDITSEQIPDQKDDLEALNEPFTKVRGSLDTDKPRVKYLPRKCKSCQTLCKYVYYMVSEEVSGAVLDEFKDYVWCSWCYSNALYSAEIPSHTITRVVVPIGAEAPKQDFMVKEWSPEKYEKLYDAIDRLGLDWNGVQKDMGADVTVRECIYHFVISPLESEARGSVRMPVCFSDVRGEKDAIPFFTSENTITAFLSFCASMLSPIVASRAAKVILDRVMQGDGNTAIVEPPQTSKVKDGDEIAKDTETTCPKPESNGVDSKNQEQESRDQESMKVPGELKNNKSSSKGSQERGKNKKIKKSLEDDNMDPSSMSNATITDTTLYEAFKEALRTSKDTCSEVAEMEQEKISELLGQLIELKIRRIKQKIHIHTSATEHMNNNGVKMRLELSRILQTDTNT